MNIAMMLPANYAIGNPFNGVREQAMAQASALESMGHCVTRMSSWEKYDLSSFDVVHYFFGGPWMNLIEKIPGSANTIRVFAPMIDTLQSSSRYRFSSFLGNLHPNIDTVQAQYRKQALNADLVIVRSTFESTMVTKGLGIPVSKVRTVLNGCPAPVPTNSELAFKHIGFDSDFVLHISRYSNKSKNVLNMINGIGPTDLPLVIAGTHDQSLYQRAIVDAAANYPNVHLIGRVSDELRNSLYSACRVFCLPSTREGTGLVALEAASYGARVVITPEGGPPDYLGKLAHYIGDTSPASIAKAVQQAWQQESTDALASHVREKLSWSASAGQLLQAYTEFSKDNTPKRAPSSFKVLGKAENTG